MPWRRIARSVALALALAGWGDLRADFLTGLDAWNRGDHATALREWRVLAEQGDAESQFRVGHLVHHGEGGGDPAEAARWYRRAADQGHAGAQNNLGLLHEAGLGVDRDEAEAARRYQQAAENRLTAGQVNLARLYEEGRGVAQDLGLAAHWYRRAAEDGHAEAQYRLGRLYEQGRGVPADAKRAARWYRKAAHHGHLAALDALAAVRPAGEPPAAIVVEAAPRMPETGAIEPRPAAGEPQAGVDPLRERALAGDAESQYQLGLRYSQGAGGAARSLAEAGRWYQEAARAGHAPAAYRLALLAMRGLGLWERKDLVAAHRWFCVAAEQGLGDAAVWRDQLAAKMTGEELAESARQREGR